MTEKELENFESELRQARPAPIPASLHQRLLLAKPPTKPATATATGLSLSEMAGRLFVGWRWLVPASLAVFVVLGLWPRHEQGPLPSPPALATDPAVEPVSALNASDIVVDQQLVSSFETVAWLPSGEPVRFRCENWIDQVTLKDERQGLTVENRIPRFEVVALGPDIY